MSASTSGKGMWWLLAVLLVVLAAAIVLVRQNSLRPSALEQLPPVPVATSWQEMPVASPPPQGITGSIESPIDESQVQRCARMTGTVVRPTGKTVMTAMRNLDNGDPAWYGEKLLEQPEPGSSGRWTGIQYFGSQNSSVGQRYEVVLALIDADIVFTDDLAADDLGAFARSGLEVAKVTYERISGVPDDLCEGP